MSPSLLQTTGGKNELNMVLCGNCSGCHKKELRMLRHMTSKIEYTCRSDGLTRYFHHIY